jgi:ubiquinone/menaquinone biosynthesis C-methylase UbiE
MISSLAAWALPMLALTLVVRSTGATLRYAEAVQAFSASTIIGGITGIPLGIGVTGSLMILSLEAIGVAAGAAALSVAVFRATTTWFAMALGIAVLLSRRRQLMNLLRPQTDESHFDLIADVYESQIPGHIRDRLLERKVALIRKVLRAKDFKDHAQGLDIGSGQGWYAIEMNRGGYEMVACDHSLNQLKRAIELDVTRSLTFTGADAQHLPFHDESFDFAYGINFMHHISDGRQRERSFQEILRILKPHGLFFLHEINTENPLFRLYMGYLFPLLRQIDVGTEDWIRPRELPRMSGARWDSTITYFNFLPDFTPSWLHQLLAGFERRLENSAARRWGSHYMAILQKDREQPDV